MKKVLIFCLLLAAQFTDAQTAIQLNISASRVVYNPLYHKAYVAVSDNDPQYPKSILQINPITGTIEKRITLPQIPLTIRQSHDLKCLYVSYKYQPDILKIALEEFIVSDTLNTGNLKVLDFAILPSDNNTLVVIRGDGSYPDDLVMYKNGVLQPRQESTSSDNFSSLCFKNDGSRLYAHNGITSGSEGRLVKVLDDGIEFYGKTWDYMMSNYGFVKNNNDLLYDETGKVLDPFSDSIPKLIANMPIYKIAEYSRSGFEYSALHGSYVFGHALDYRGYISFFHGESYNYQGSIALKGQVQMIYDLAVVDSDHFILVALRNSTDNRILLLVSAKEKDKMILQQRSSSADNISRQNRSWGINPKKTGKY
ncbi:MAG: hypothetical protein ACOYN4_09690 [Bacteroidales bacterium]